MIRPLWVRGKDGDITDVRTILIPEAVKENHRVAIFTEEDGKTKLAHCSDNIGLVITPPKLSRDGRRIMFDQDLILPLAKRYLALTFERDSFEEKYRQKTWVITIHLQPPPPITQLHLPIIAAETAA